MQVQVTNDTTHDIVLPGRTVLRNLKLFRSVTQIEVKLKENVEAKRANMHFGMERQSTSQTYGSVGHKVYRKPTHTDRYHPTIKNSVCKTLINRAKTIREVSNIDNELEHFRNVLKLNGYPRQFIDKAMKMPQRVQQKTEYQSSVCLSYIGPASHKIERILKEVQ